MPKVVDLFSGGGGMSLGFQKAGFDVVAAFENWDSAIECYRENFNHPIYKQDLSDEQSSIEKISKYKPDIIIGGPPCQDFSQAGKRIEGDKADLTIHFANIVIAVKPKVFVMENVDRVKNSGVYQIAKEKYNFAGYELSEVVLDASLCGVPQKRKRFFCIGTLNTSGKSVVEYLNSNLADKPMTIRDYFGDSLGIEGYYRHPRNYNRRGIFSIDEPAPTIRGVNRPIPPGYSIHPNDAVKDLSVVRPLTTIERSLIQTFPASFKFKGTKTNLEQIIGNAVPVTLAQYVAKGVKTVFESNQEIDYISLEKWLINNKEYSLRTVKDVISRLKRLDNISRISVEYLSYMKTIESNSEYARLSKSVQSQLKKSYKLYLEYLGYV
ncbi:TPA: DNA cytosine methyltransferase [Streptococcus suis]